MNLTELREATEAAIKVLDDPSDSDDDLAVMICYRSCTMPKTILKLLDVVEAAKGLYPALNWIQAEWDFLQDALKALEDDR